MKILCFFVVFCGSLVGICVFFCGFWWEFAGSLVGIQWEEEPEKGEFEWECGAQQANNVLA